jgi:SM-20-related protein
MINYAATVRHTYEPFAWHLATGLLRPEQVSELERNPPSTEGARRAIVEGTRRDKQYRMNVLTLVADNARTPATETLASVWKCLLDELESDAFLGWLSDLVDINLRGLPAEIGVYTYTKGDYISLHKDKPTKALTAILYLNEDWPIGGGGEFEVRASARSADDPVESVPPRGGQLLAFPPSDSSWHAVSVIETEHVTRLTMQLEYWLSAS